jgi:N-dimethylarginine dimethylaminohydrolase
MKEKLEKILKKYNKKEYVFITDGTNILANANLNCEKHILAEIDIELRNEIEKFLKSVYIKNYILILDGFTIISRVKSCEKCKKETEHFFSEVNKFSIAKTTIVGSDKDLDREFNTKC